MTLKFGLKLVQIVLAVLIVLLSLIQSKGNGLSAGLKSSFSAYRSLRGVEKLVFYSTIASGVLIVANSILLIVL